jgi:uncharacterized protein YfdQ (DUF2303 family)
MDRTAIETIAGLAVAQANASRLQDLDTLILPKDYVLADLEKFQEAPVRFRGKFFTTILTEFCDYVTMHGSEYTAVYIDNIQTTATAIIDQGNHDEPQWGNHHARLTLSKTPEYRELLDNKNSQFPQQKFIEFLEDWKANITFSIDGVACPNSDFDKIIRSLRRVKVDAISTREQAVGNHAQSRSALEAVEIKSGNDTLPTEFIFKCNPYEGFLPVEFTCPIRSTSDDKGIRFAYRINQLDAKKDLIAEEFRVKIGKMISDRTPEIKVHIGTMEYQ